MQSETAGTDSPTSAIMQYVRHPFASDEVYLWTSQQGLSGIASSGALDGLDEEDKEGVLRRTRVFYFNQITGSSISEEEAKTAEASHPPTNSGMPSQPNLSDKAPPGSQGAPFVSDEPHTLTFAELQAMIEQGRTDEIPNNKHIPDVLNVAQSTPSVVPPRRKPWETAPEIATPGDS